MREQPGAVAVDGEARRAAPQLAAARRTERVDERGRAQLVAEHSGDDDARAAAPKVSRNATQA